MKGTRLTRIRCLAGHLLFGLVTLVVSCSGGDEDRSRSDTPPHAVLSAPGTVSAGVAVVFDASRSSDPDPGDRIVEYRFLFDDGVEVKRPTPFAAHAFTDAGPHSVTLAVQDSFGIEATATASLEVIPDGGPEIRFRLPESGVPLYSEIPFPNNLYMDAGGRISVPGIPYRMILFGNIVEKAFGALDGFGTSTAVYFWTDGPIDPSSLPKTARESTEYGSSAFLVNVDPHSGGFLERHPVEAHFDEAKGVIALLPAFGYPLREHTTYAAVLTTKVRGRNGGNVLASEDFSRLREGASGPGTLGTANEVYAPVVALLEHEQDIGDRRVCAGIAVFRTQTITADLEHASEILDRLDPPRASILAFFTDDRDLCADPRCRGDLDTLLGTPHPGYEEAPGMDNPGGLAHTWIKTVITKASFLSPWFKKESVKDPDYGAFVHAPDGTLLVQDWRELFFSLVIPKVERPGGCPVALIQHGLNGRRDFVMVAANELAKHGIASIAIDAVGHGDRYRCPVLGPVLEGMCVPKDETFNYTGAPGQDGLPDPEFLSSTLGFFELFASGLSMRDNFRQTVVDLMWLTRLIRGRHLDLSAVGSPRLDGDHIFYIGDSLGGIIGGIFMTAEPHVRTGVLNVAGGGIGPSLLVNSPGITGDYGSLIQLAFSLPGDELESTYSQFVNLAQTILDAGDPINYAPYALKNPLAGGRPKNILQIEVMWDHLVPNSSNEALARAFGLPLLAPYYHQVPDVREVDAPFTGEDGFTAALVQYFPAGHGTDLANQYYDLEWQLGFPFEDGERFRRLPECSSGDDHPWCHLRSPIAQVQEQIVRFFTSYLEGGVPEIVSTMTPERDFDHDGIPDEEEIRGGTDPLAP